MPQSHLSNHGIEARLFRAWQTLIGSQTAIPAHGNDFTGSNWECRIKGSALRHIAKSAQRAPSLKGTVDDWKKSKDGGKAAFYRVERREASGGEWAMVGTALETEITLNNQERGREWEYRVIAVNKAGESEPSNIVTAVL